MSCVALKLDFGSFGQSNAWLRPVVSFENDLILLVILVYMLVRMIEILESGAP
jgi:hypothetical protein